MNRLLKTCFLVLFALLLMTQRMPAPFVEQEDTPAPDATPKKKTKKVVKTTHTSVKKTTAAPSPTVAVPVAPTAPGAAGVPAPAAVTAPAPAAPTTAPGPATVAPAASNPPPVLVASPELVGAVRRTVVKPTATLDIIYTVSASQPFDSKQTGQKVRFSIQEVGVRDLTTENRKVSQQQVNLTRNTSINTGRSKNLVQLREALQGAFQRFLGGAPTVGQEVGRWGDAGHGGELHLVAEDADTLRFDYVPNTANVLSFKRAEVQKFADLLAQ